MTSILIVDDDERMRSLMRSLLSDLADPITECTDGADARAFYEQQHPDWVLMDVTMPRLNGIEATRQIKAVDPAARIVIVTGNDSRRLRAAATSAGAFAFVSKENLLDLRRVIEPGGADAIRL